jgi:predicted dehydrogenase
MNRPVRIGIVGTGWWATTAHFPAVLAHPDAVLAGIADRDPERLAAAAAAFDKPPAYPNHRELLANANLDAVIVATSHASHHAIAADCLDSGCHVLVEKPLTLRAQHARDLARRARRAGKHLSVAYNYNHNPPTAVAKAWLADPELGEILAVEASFNSHHRALLAGDDTSSWAYKVHGPGKVYSDPAESGGGHGHLQLTHIAGTVFHLTDLRASQVNARMAHHGLAVDLVNSVMVEFEGGALGTFTGSSNANQRRCELFVTCEHGTVDLDLVAGTVRRRLGDHPVETFGPDPDIYPLSAPVGDLVDMVRTGRPPHVSAETGCRAVELLDAAYRSADNNAATVLVSSLFDNPTEDDLP